MDVTRRDAMKMAGIGAAGALGVWSAGGAGFGGAVLARTASELEPSELPTPFTTAFTVPPVLRPAHWEYDDAGRLVRQHFHLTAQQVTTRVLPRLTTRMWGYNGMVPGPTIKVERGVETTVRVRNRLPALHPLFGYEFTTSTHLHGSASLPQYDGYADDVTPPGFFKDYQYPNHQPARTIWYHDHAVHNTAKNVYSGLVAQYHIHDAVERSLLPQGKFDVPVTISDVLFGPNGELAYDDESESGLYGDVILVNGRPWPVMKVQKRVYRFRILVATASRSFRFRLSTGEPVHVVATDGGLMPRTQSVTQWRHGGAERYEVLIDFRGYQTGQRIVLQNLSNDNNRDYDHTDKVMAFDVLDDTVGEGVVDKSDPTWDRIPDTLTGSHVMDLTAAASARTRQLRMERTNSLWTINGAVWADVVASGYKAVLADPGLGDVETWRIENSSGGWFHPTHIHLVDFRLLSRNGRAPEPYEQGPKDVVYIGENETVDVVAQFGDPARPQTKGRYMVHCHNLVHEDHDMMHQFSVGGPPGAVDENDPILADPCDYDDLPEERGVAPGSSPAPLVRPLVGAVEMECFDAEDDGGDEVTGYRIMGFVGPRLVLDQMVDDEHFHIIDGLEPGTTYEFTSSAVNQTGEGPQSARSLPVTPRAVVAQAPLIGVASLSGARVSLTWSAPADAVSPVTGYDIRVLGPTGLAVGDLVPVAAGTTQMLLPPLPPGQYRFRVRARTEAGPTEFSADSNPLTVTAPGTAAQDRVWPQVVALGPRVNARNVRRGAQVTARFSERVTKVNARTVVLRRANGKKVPATVTYDPATRRVTLKPRRRLAPRTRYVVSFAPGIRDLAGNPLIRASWAFTTGARS